MTIFPTGVPGCQRLLNTQLACLLQPQRATLPCKTLVCLPHSLAVLISSQSTSCFDYEVPFSVANAGWPTSFSIEALYTSIKGTPCKMFPSSVAKISLVARLKAKSYG
jgi:hypothetical protein